MATSSLLALIDDIAMLLDDVAAMTQVAATKTAGVLGDDLALNAHQVAGVAADRELPVVWAVARGSMLNKAILVPLALLISAWLPWAVMPLLMLGGAFLCYEGFEKLAHRWLHSAVEDAAHHTQLLAAVAQPEPDLMAFERDKIRGAVRTDFILSAEIITITLGTVATAPLAQRITVLCLIAVAMTVGVYGLVAGIVKLDDAGLWLQRQRRAAVRALGAGMVRLAPRLMKFLSVAGTLAMLVVGGGILVHGIGPLYDVTQALAKDPTLAWLLSVLADALVGVLAGALVLVTVSALTRAFSALRRAAP